jgi:dephospho-CoA kinase
MVVGITGSIATGKSVVSKYLADRKYQIIDADFLAKREIQKPEVIEEIKKEFGIQVIKDGQVDRQVLGRLVFNDETARRKLNKIIHPGVIRNMKDEIKRRKGLVFLDIPLLYEENLEELVDKIIVVYTRFETQLHRLMERDGIDEEYARRKIATQMDIETKKERADFVIDNENNLEQTYAQIEKIIRRLENEV